MATEENEFWFKYVAQAKTRSGGAKKPGAKKVGSVGSDKRFNRRISASKITMIEVAGKTYEVDTINVSHSGMLVETEAPLEVGTKVTWGDEEIGKVEGTVARVTPDGYGIILRPGQSAAAHVLREITDGLLATEGDPEGRQPAKRKSKPKKRK